MMTTLRTTTLEATTSRQDRRPRRRRLLALAVAMGIGVALLGVTPSPASAATEYSGQYPGYVSGDKVAGYDRNVFDMGRTVYESPQYANQQQKVCITTQLWQVVYAGYGTGQTAFWKNVQSHTRCGWISAAQTSIRDNGVYFGVAGGTFNRITADVRWYATNGAQIGSKFIDYNTTSDYTCFHSLWRCNIGTTYFGTRSAQINFQ